MVLERSILFCSWMMMMSASCVLFSASIAPDRGGIFPGAARHSACRTRTDAGTSAAAVVGTVIGERILKRVPEPIYRRVVSVLVLALGVHGVSGLENRRSYESGC